jgi:peroxiredoxin
MRKWIAGIGTSAVAVLLAATAFSVHASPQLPPVGKSGGEMAAATRQGPTPSVGQRAPDFTLVSLEGTTVRLSEQLTAGPVVLVVLRGFPTYQCPFCTRQFGEYMGKRDEFQATGARVLFVYPGPADGLISHATALVADRPLPPSYRILTDPDYALTLAYNLRWDAPKETAYPSTFVIDKQGVVAFAHISREHGDRVPAADVLKALAALRR